MRDIILEIENCKSENEVQGKIYHTHDGYQFICVYKGSVEIIIDSKHYQVDAPSIILINSFEEHRIISTSEDYSRYLLTINTFITDKLVRDLNLIQMLKHRPHNFNHIVDISEITRPIIYLLEWIIYEKENARKFSSEITDNIVSQFLMMIAREFFTSSEFNSGNSVIDEIQEYIDKNFATIDTISNIADKFFINSSYLSHSFKRVTGYSVKNYLTFTRLHKAKSMLLHSDKSVSSIALDCGFSDVNNFIQLFKRTYNITPLQFRKNAKG